jgi:hypothetical protein
VENSPSGWGDLIADEHIDHSRDSVRLSETSVAPSSGIIVAEDVHFRQGRVGFGEARVESDGFEQQAKCIFGFEGHAI